MKSDRVPNNVNLRVRVVLRAQEAARCICSIHFEALPGDVLVGEAEVVKQRSNVDQLAIKLHLARTADEFRKPPCPMDVVEESRPVSLCGERFRLAGELRIRRGEPSDGDGCGHGSSMRERLARCQSMCPN